MVLVRVDVPSSILDEVVSDLKNRGLNPQVVSGSTTNMSLLRKGEYMYSWNHRITPKQMFQKIEEGITLFMATYARTRFNPEFFRVDGDWLIFFSSDEYFLGRSSWPVSGFTVARCPIALLRKENYSGYSSAGGIFHTLLYKNRPAGVEIIREGVSSLAELIDLMGWDGTPPS